MRAEETLQFMMDPISSSSVKITNELKSTKNILNKNFKTAQFFCF